MGEGKKQSTLSGVTRERVLCFGLNASYYQTFICPKVAEAPFLSAGQQQQQAGTKMKDINV